MLAVPPTVPPILNTLLVRDAHLVVHALGRVDYSMRVSQVQIAVFFDRIEITNPGVLAFGQTMAKAL